MDSLAPTRTAAAEIERPTPTARHLAEASISPNTRGAYSGALRRLDAWLDGRPLEDATLATYLAEFHDQGRASASASTAVAAACFRAPPRRRAEPGRGTDGPGPRRLPADRRRSRPGAGAAVRGGGGPGRRPRHLATRPRRRGRGVESDPVALERGRLDAVIAGLLFMAGMRRSEVSALRWADVGDAADGDGVLVTIRRSKTNQ